MVRRKFIKSLQKKYKDTNEDVKNLILNTSKLQHSEGFNVLWTVHRDIFVR